jgi:hypothetical protein
MLEVIFSFMHGIGVGLFVVWLVFWVYWFFWDNGE